MNREFLEEVGTAVTYTNEDHCFSYLDTSKPNQHVLTSVFCKHTSDVNLFNSILAAFHTLDRKAYVDEVLGVVGLPLFLEGPENPADYNGWSVNIYGLPKYLTWQGGIFSRPNAMTSPARDHFLLVLLKSRVISVVLMTRIFDLCQMHKCPPTVEDGGVQGGTWPILGTIGAFLGQPGVQDMLK
eukprot:CAMPEP_0119049706 /NCGR_PEP_ID=MMETSP1177-20130426/65980_1 /TAXON_ID=2985 /ORGANISM="Ochromonas sp, Strain CCMP1899" /LENGTH=183 /DNA_ID=CAMNT_0007027249 /DNA_START=212 /DNA_END=763 /DNA_ORIENTATION=+